MFLPEILVMPAELGEALVTSADLTIRSPQRLSRIACTEYRTPHPTLLLPQEVSLSP